MIIERPAWRPNALPGSCAIPGCTEDIDAGEGLVLKTAQLTHLRASWLGKETALFCCSHALATAPVGRRLRKRIDYVRRNPPINKMTGEPMHFGDYQAEGALQFARHWAFLLSDDKGLGKQNPVDTLVATPTGWRQIGQLKVGDLVIGSNGRPTRVLGIYPQGVKPSYRVALSSGASVEAGPEHLWTALYWRGGKKKAAITLTTEQLQNRPIVNGLDLSKTELYCPVLNGPAEFDPVELPIEPYAMGALLANGYLGGGHGASLSYRTEDWPHVVAKLAALDLSEPRPFNEGGTAVRVGVRGLMPQLRMLGANVRSALKRIPAVYQRGTPAQRTSLLHGLMDADGSISKTRNRVTYHTTSPGLAEDVCELVRMLGGIATVRRYDRTNEGKPVEFHVRVRVPNRLAPFSLPRKLDRYSPGNRAGPVHSFREVSYVRDVESVCIRVEASDCLYLTEGAILTHNTAQFLLALPDRYDHGGLAPVVLVCPSSVKGEWADEAALWRPDYKVQILQGRNSWLPPRPGVIFILNYAILPKREKRCRCGHHEHRHPIAPDDAPDPDWPAEEWNIPRDHAAFSCLDCKCFKFRFRPASWRSIRKRLKILPGTILGGDEVQRVKGAATRQTKRWRELASACTRVYGLSASPMMNHHNELFEVYASLGTAQAAWKTRKYFQTLFKEFKKTGRVPHGDIQAEIRERRSWVELGRTAEDVGIELPELRFVERRITLTKKDIDAVEEILLDAIATRRAWQDVADGLIADPEEHSQWDEWKTAKAKHLKKAYVEDELIAALKDAIELGPKSKIGPQMMQVRKIIATAKLPYVKGWVEECEEAEEPAVLFSAHVEPCRTFGARDGWVEVTGRITGKRRMEAIRDWQAGKFLGLTGTIRCIGEGLNLQRARLAGFVDWDWTPELNNQAAKRIHRRGQKRACLIVAFVADHPVDIHVAEILEVKRQLIEACSIQGVKA